MTITQGWTIITKSGSTIQTSTPMGVGPMAALAQAGIATWEFESITPTLPECAA